MANKKRLCLAGLLLVGAASILAPNIHAEDNNLSKPKIIATFEYESHRPKYKDIVFKYNLLSDNTISQADKPTVKFVKTQQGWAYDIDADGKFSDAELNAIKSGKLVYMHPEFNKIADSKLKESLVQAVTEKPPVKEKVEVVKKPTEKLEEKVVVQEVKAVISPTKQYLLGKSEELGLDYEGWLNSLNAKDQEVFTTFANGLIKVIDDLPNNYKSYAQEKFERLLDTSDVKEVYAEIKQDVLNMPTKEYNTFMGALTDDVKMLDSFLKDNTDSVERISYSLKESPPEFKQALIDLQNLYLTDLGPLTTNNY
ncbi:MAG: hypothetical protein NTU63_03100 [Candidatus Pacearchaeota archaeon]|nr:hypothetical protein [Candidatus Pacearchaeota archaeon]